MTSKLTQCLKIGGALLIVWIMALNDKFVKLDSASRFHVFLIPIYGLIAFGVVSLIILINQVIRINNCDQAYVELKEEIKEARIELKKKGFKFE